MNGWTYIKVWQVDHKLVVAKTIEDAIALYKTYMGKEYKDEPRIIRAISSDNYPKDYDTLEVKDVDLEKEVINWWNAHYSSKAYTFEGYSGHYVENSTLIEIAKHFFELGLKAQKGE